MLRGEAYLRSPHKRRFDKLLACLAMPTIAPAALLELFVMIENRDRQALCRQPRDNIIQDENCRYDFTKWKTLAGEITHGTSPNGFSHPAAGTVGTFMRRWHADDALQFIDVIRGRMSMIGPRPLTLVDHEEVMSGLCPRQQKRYIDIKRMCLPGVIPPYGTLPRDAERNIVAPLLFEGLDRYATEASLGFDLRIIGQTASIVLGESSSALRRE